MPHETSIRLPGRLTGIVRTHGPAPVATPAVAAQPAAAPSAAAADATCQRTYGEAVERALQALGDAAAALQAQRQVWAQAIEPLAVELALAVAARFLQVKVTAGEFPWRALIHQALDRLEASQPVTVSLHPDDLAAIQKQLAEEDTMSRGPELRIVADETLGRGCFKVQAQERLVGFDLDSRLEALRQQLHDTVTTHADNGPTSAAGGNP